MAVTPEGRSRNRELKFTNPNIVSGYGKCCQTLQALKYDSPALEKNCYNCNEKFNSSKRRNIITSNFTMIAVSRHSIAFHDYYLFI